MQANITKQSWNGKTVERNTYTCSWDGTKKDTSTLYNEDCTESVEEEEEEESEQPLAENLICFEANTRKLKIHYKPALNYAKSVN